VLKITRTETAAEEKWTLHGRLEGLWASELRRIWKKAHRTDNTLKCIVDLNDVTSLDRSGERALIELSKEGAELIATGIYMRHVVHNIERKKSRRHP
jgi:anti-anti-sigma regulatory factor